MLFQPKIRLIKALDSAQKFQEMKEKQKDPGGGVEGKKANKGRIYPREEHRTV
jgi:hypothetical protein